jgi:hypothetical protein
MQTAMRSFKPPALNEGGGGRFSVFLAGSIEMGAAAPWQAVVEERLRSLPVDVYNPRRDDWDASWRQEIDEPNFLQQVEWELDHLEAADLKVFFFDPATRSPVTLMELGLVLGSAPEKCLVCCPPGFWRRGNVLITGRRAGVETLDDLPRLIEKIAERIDLEVNNETASPNNR